MNKKTNTTENSQTDKQETRFYWQRIRRGVLGGLVIMVAMILLWSIGDSAYTPDIRTVSPPDSDFPAVLPDQRLNEAAKDIQALEKIEIVKTRPKEKLTVSVTVASSISASQETSQKTFINKNSENEEANTLQVTAKATSVKASITADIDNNNVDEASPFMVQIGAFSEQKRARRVEKKLIQNKFKAQVEKIKRDNVFLYRVRAIGYQTRAQAELARQKIVELGYANAQIRDMQ